MQSIISTITITDPRKYKQLYMRAATLYYLRLTFPSTINKDKEGTNSATGCGNMVGNTLYKLGYTTTSLHERVYGRTASYRYGKNGKCSRIAGHIGMGLPTGTDVAVISTYAHRNASYVYQLEQELHGRYRSERWQGLPVMGNGNSELYASDILDLDY